MYVKLIVSLAAAALIGTMSPAAALEQQHPRTAAGDYSAQTKKKKVAPKPKAESGQRMFTDPSRAGHGRIQSYRR